jgi:hypothetical protein
VALESAEVWSENSISLRNSDRDRLNFDDLGIDAMKNFSPPLPNCDPNYDRQDVLDYVKPVLKKSDI